MPSPETLDTLLAVQALDTSADQLRHRRSHLPERAELTQRQEALADVERRAAALQADREVVARTEKRIEDEIAGVKARIENADRNLYSGATNSPKELQAIQDEIASLKRRVSDLEDEELVAMEEAEPLDEQLAALAAEQAALDDDCARLLAAVAEAEAGIDAELEDAASRRAEAVAGVAADVLEQYDALRARMAGIAIARLSGSRCEGCHLTLPAVDLDRIRHEPPDAEITCPECGRLLVR